MLRALASFCVTTCWNTPSCLLFLLCAMTYINTLEERNVFEALRSRMVAMGFSLRAIYWITGLLAFSISPLADNLTTGQRQAGSPM
jgi:Na+/H+ antiporter NhaD/arsenite permease-like protein